MNNPKYVMVDEVFPIIFHPALEHSIFKNMKVTSAGFVMIEKGKVHTYGKSISLNMGVNKIDDFLIEKTLNLGAK